MQKFSLSVLVVISLCFCAASNAADKPEKAAKTPKLKCPVSGQPATKDHAVKYKEGEVYFCCDNCPKAFAADTKKFATKANAQLVSTSQYKETKCPLTGKDLNPAATVKVAGISVAFCCNNCKGKVAKARGDARTALVFSDEAFAKGFEKDKDAGKDKDAAKDTK